MLTARTPVLGQWDQLISPLISLASTGVNAYLEKERQRKADLEAARARNAAQQAASAEAARRAQEAALYAQAGYANVADIASTSTVVQGVPDIALYAGGAGLLALLFLARR